jgi:hypothetical protein
MNAEAKQIQKLESELEKDKKIVRQMKKRARHARGFLARKNAKRALKTIEDGVELVKLEKKILEESISR